MNGENRKGWFTGDGMTYLYNGQLDHYVDYWPVVDSHRLPGTTVDTQVMQESQGQRNQIKGGRKSDMHWVGSVSLANYGVAGMRFTNWDHTLSANKSWFMLRDEVVMLGSDINSSRAAPLATVLTNRKVPTQGITKVWTDGVDWSGDDGISHDIHSFSIRNDQLKDSDLSYVFFAPTDILVKREHRSGNWSEIGTQRGEVNGEFISAQLEHGPGQSGYAYALLPNASAEMVQSYANEPMLSIERKDALAHAIYDKKLNLLAANVWSDGEVRINDQFTAFDPMAVMVHQEEGLYQVAISDPTQMQTSVRIKFNEHMTVADDLQNRVQVNSSHELVVDVSGLKGQSYQISILPEPPLKEYIHSKF